jgi:hypothetical protein
MDVLGILVLVALLVSVVCLVLSLFKVPFTIPAWVVWAMFTLAFLLMWLGRR